MANPERAGLGAALTTLGGGIEREIERGREEKRQKHQRWLSCVMGGNSPEACSQLLGYDPGAGGMAGAGRFQGEAMEREKAKRLQDRLDKLDPDERRIAYSRDIPGEAMTMRGRLPKNVPLTLKGKRIVERPTEYTEDVVGRMPSERIPSATPRPDWEEALWLHGQEQARRKKRGELSGKIAGEERAETRAIEGEERALGRQLGKEQRELEEELARESRRRAEESFDKELARLEKLADEARKEETDIRGEKRRQKLGEDFALWKQKHGIGETAKGPVDAKYILNESSKGIGLSDQPMYNSPAKLDKMVRMWGIHNELHEAGDTASESALESLRMPRMESRPGLKRELLDRSTELDRRELLAEMGFAEDVIEWIMESFKRW